MSDNADIQLIETALVEFSKVEAGLQALRTQYSGVVFATDTTVGMDEAKAARMTLREPRYEVERVRKAAKAPLLALGKKLDADAARITAEIEKLEKPIDQQIKAEEERKEREKQAKIAAEEARVAGIQDRITELRAVVSLNFHDDAALVLDHIGDIERIEVDESFAEFQAIAADAKASSLARLKEIHAGIVERKAEKARIAAERVELERLRAEQAEREKAERARIAEEEKAAKAVRDAEAAKAAEALRIEREELEAERVKQSKAADAEAAKLAAERAEVEKQRAENERIAKERADAERRQQEQERAAKERAAAAKKKRPTDAEIIKAIADHFNVTEQTAAGWVASMRAAA